mgnify:FL=1
MTEDKKASTMVKAIVDYIYEEGAGNISNCEVLGVIEFVKLQLIEDFNQSEEVE